MCTKYTAMHIKDQTLETNGNHYTKHFFHVKLFIGHFILYYNTINTYSKLIENTITS